MLNNSTLSEKTAYDYLCLSGDAIVGNSISPKFTNNYKIVNVTVIYAFKLFRVYLDS